ncbi:uncharacterized protein LOC117226277 [Megalopta genalis]|uniref:uncharacterized protein LOC117226277 n=1 Tax=Megalopta genalis TaxID=115081 RepID=UPI0014438773|nr:uncharacterized protein LOC117226277 [Megalopta genalis]
MNGPETLAWWLCFAIAVNEFAVADQDEKDVADSNGTLQFDISRGIEFHLANNETAVVVRMSALLADDESEQRAGGRLKFKGLLNKIGSTMMMVPFLIQMISLPGTLASIKFSLLRSIVVGKLAMLIILYNVLKNSQRSEVVVVHKPEYHEHYYHSYHQPEDDDEGWLGR